MKRLIYCILLLLGIASCSPTTNYLKTDQTLPLNKIITINEEAHLIGGSNRDGLKLEPFQEWFDKFYNEYQPQKEILKKANSKTKGVEILAFMGTWCGDSKREVPRFYRVLDDMGFDENNLKLVNLGLKKEKYKKSPNGEEQGLNIHRVPTFIFYKNGKEIGRIVESPTTSLEMDMAQILIGLPTKEKYEVVTKLNENITQKGIQDVRLNLEKWVEDTKRHARSEYELNTYGVVLLYSEKVQEALTVFQINTKAFTDNGYLFYCLGRAHEKLGEKELAIENFQKAIELDPEDESAKKALGTLKE